MTLQEYIHSFPKDERMTLRQTLAYAHGVSETTVRSWANGLRKHPPILKAIEITERITNQQVTRYDLRPEVFGNGSE